ncbi:competence type IV pilus minor pilin ComGD [Paucilactobacillus nenjiangensis]|uniref:competence type IV pilus minor pilin ComGD n=1 Tax=Paucilactobacillus nenjiangensis TaxID=1296540 RepID=UPI0028D87C51|nr:competence type IV pilus minor pilin ComGD [Paucilactobacillus nenjiangensis]
MAKQNGFTMIETVIVLALIALMFVFGTMKLGDLKAASDERRFWTQLERSWQQSQSRAQNHGKPTTIRQSKNQTEILFRSHNRRNDDDNRDVKVPKTIIIKKFDEITMLQNGYVKATTEKFYSTRTHKEYSMKVQLAWGGYYIDKE